MRLLDIIRLLFVLVLGALLALVTILLMGGML